MTTWSISPKATSPVALTFGCGPSGELVAFRRDGDEIIGYVAGARASDAEVGLAMRLWAHLHLAAIVGDKP